MKKTIVGILLVFYALLGYSQCKDLVDSYYDSIAQFNVYYGIQHSSDPPITILITDNDSIKDIKLSVMTAGLRSLDSDSITVLMDFEGADSWNRRMAELNEEKIGSLYKYTATMVIDESDIRFLANNPIKQFRIEQYYYFLKPEQSDHFMSVSECLLKEFF